MADARPVSPPDASRPHLVAAVVSIVLAAAVLRPAITALGPLVPRIGADTGLGAAALGLLGALPIACFALVSAGVHAPAKRLGATRMLAVALVVLGAGTALRLVPGLAPLWVGTALIGLGIAVTNVLLPALVKRWFPGRVSLLTGLYTTVLGLFAALGSGLAVPLAEAAGGDWHVALAGSLPIVVAAAAWWGWQLAREGRAVRGGVARGGVARGGGGGASASGDASVPAAPASGAVTAAPAADTPMWRSGTAWLVTAFMGVQSFSFYVTIAWLPSIEQSAGVTEGAAGWHLSLNQLAGMLGGVIATAAMGRRHDQRLVAVATSLPLLAACAGLAVAPGAAPALWSGLLGIAQGSSLVLALSLVGLRTTTPHDTSRLSGMAQSVGYALAAVGPLATGLLRQVTGSWLPVVVVLAVAAVAQGVVGYLAGRDVVIGPAVGDTGGATPKERP